MSEIELKIELDPAREAALRRGSGLAALREGALRSTDLASVYFDTADQALARAGLVLRVRRDGRAWVQTIKRRSAAMAGGLSAPEEEERTLADPLPLLLAGDPLAAEVAGRIGRHPLRPVFETRFRRSRCLLRLPSGARVELAIDKGELRAGDRQAPLHEAEIEVKEGAPAAVYEAAALLFPTGPVRFCATDKASRAATLAGLVVPVRKPDGPGPDTPVGRLFADACADCLDQIAGAMVTIADSTDPDGPHQLRIGLRRLRTVLDLLPPVAGLEAVAQVAAMARDLGQAAGGLRDLDVLHAAVTDTEVAPGLDAPARAALAAALASRRESVRADVRARLAGRDATAFLFMLGGLSASPGSGTEAEQPIGSLGPARLDHRLARVRRRGRHIADLPVEALHDLRKELKKLRYAVEFLAPISQPRRVAPFVAALKKLQDGFGALNDAAVAVLLLGDPAAPGRRDPDAQRAAGWVMGEMEAAARRRRSALFGSWDRFRAEPPFWRTTSGG